MEIKKLTIEVPLDLLERATGASGQGITPTIRRGLELVAASGAYGRLRDLKGKIKDPPRVMNAGGKPVVGTKTVVVSLDVHSATLPMRS